MGEYCGKEDHHFVGKFLQKMGFISVLPNYSIFPTGHVEDMIDDIDLVFEWVFQNIHKFGGNNKKYYCWDILQVLI